MTPLDYEKFKPVLTDSTGKRLTSGLFEELHNPSSAAKPVFKLSDWRKVYVEIADPTDYKAAMVLIGDWEHWKCLLKCPFFMEELEKWREEVDVKLKSAAVELLVKHSKTVQGTSAAKWLAEHGYINKKRGRPKLPEAEPQNESKEVAEHAKRLGVVTGGKA